MFGDDEGIRSYKDLAEDYRRGMEAQDRMIADYRRDNEALLAERNGWREGFQQAERLAGLDSVAVDPSSCFPLHEWIEAVQKMRKASE